MRFIVLTLSLKRFVYNVPFKQKKVISLIMFIMFILVIFYGELPKDRDFIFKLKYVNNFNYDNSIFIYVVNALITFI